MASLLIRRSSPLRMVPVAALWLVAALGWGLYGLARWEVAGVESGLRQEIADLQAATGNFERQSKKAQTDLLALVQLREENTAARREIERLTKSLDQARAELAAARSVFSPSPDPWTAAETAAGPRTPASAEVAGASERVETAQQALTRLGHGPLAADGIMGPATRAAIERFQSEQGLAITGELDDETWQHLRGGAGVAATE
jgi:hypothetical protein